MLRYRLPILVLGAAIALMSVISYTAFSQAAGPVPNPNCSLIVPANPLSAVGLATPYQLVATNAGNGPCNEANAGQAAFVQGAIYTPGATPSISIYNPLVVDQGAHPAVAPVVPVIAAGSTVALWFGFNGNILKLVGATRQTLHQAKCVNGLGKSLFGQFSYCNAPAFFAQAKTAIANGTLIAPALGMGTDGRICPTVRDFSIVDQDQSDNVTTIYLVSGGLIAQNNAANVAALGGATRLANASDNRLLTVVDAALGCTPWMAPDLANPGVMAPALPLNELQAFAQQAAPIANVPNADPMVLRAGHTNIGKRNLYRLGVGQSTFADGNTTNYCRNLLATGLPRILADKPITVLAASPDVAVGNSLFTFIASRFVFTFGVNGLNCTGRLQVASPFVLTMDNQGVVIDAVAR